MRPSEETQSEQSGPGETSRDEEETKEYEGEDSGIETV